MIRKTIELPFATPSNNEIRHMNSWAYKRLIRQIREHILMQAGEGPWPKYVLDQKLPKNVSDQIRKELCSRWATKRKVAVEIVTRRTPRRLDSDNHDGGLKPLWDALARAGWLVSDHLRWLKKLQIEQILGDEGKTVLTFHVPESREDQEAIERMTYLVRER